MDIEGEAQPFDLIKNHAKKEIFLRNSGDNSNTERWQKYINGLNSVSVLAQQAVDFKLERARGEKPDLIASSCVKSPIKFEIKEDRIKTPKPSPMRVSPVSPVAGPSFEVKSIAKPKKEALQLEPISIKTQPKPEIVTEDKSKKLPLAEPKTEIVPQHPPYPPQSTPSEVVSKKKPLKRAKRSQGSFLGVGKPPNILVYSESLATRDNAIATLKSVLRQDL